MVKKESKDDVFINMYTWLFLTTIFILKLVFIANRKFRKDFKIDRRHVKVAKCSFFALRFKYNFRTRI